MPGVLSVRVEWGVSPEQIRRAFGRLEEGLFDWTPAMLRIREIFAEQFASIFSTHGAALDGAWEPQSPETARRRMRDGGNVSRATLRATGALEASLTAESATGDSIRRMAQPGQGVPRFVWGTKLPYAAALQFGSPSRGLPARPFVGLTDESQDAIVEVLQEQLDRRLKETAAALGGTL